MSCGFTMRCTKVIVTVDPLMAMHLVSVQGFNRVCHKIPTGKA